MDHQTTEPTAVTIIRLSFKDSEKDKANNSKEWYKAMKNFRKLPNWRYTARGQDPDDACQIILFVGWEDNVPPISFRSTEALSADLTGGTNPLAPLGPFLTSDPEVTATLRLSSPRISPGFFQTTRWLPTQDANSGPIEEIVAIRGPKSVLEPAIKAISQSLVEFRMNRTGERLHGNMPKDAFLYHTVGWMDDSDENEVEQHTFVVCFGWSSRQDRAVFKDPNTPDKALSHRLNEFYGFDFWEKTVEAPLRSWVQNHGATVSSWEYCNGRISYDGNGAAKRRQDDW